MRLKAFRVEKFRSIIDTGFRDVSPDNINVLIGQNESGKTSVLSALQSFETGKISGDDLRSDESYPEVSCDFEISTDEFQETFKEFKLPENFLKKLQENNNVLGLRRKWTADLKSELTFTDSKLSLLWKEKITLAIPSIETPAAPVTEGAVATAPPLAGTAVEVIPEEKYISEVEFIKELFDAFPLFIFFEDNTSLLPRNIDIEDIQNKKKDAPGYIGAMNFLKIIGFDTASISGVTDKRIIEDKIDKLSKEFTADFQKYWGQKIGKSDKIAIQMELKHHDGSVEAKKGNPYLTFYVKDNQGRLYADQRSQGIRWFVSFYLQLEATSKENNERIFLIDEPGGSLHAKAQEDVLKVFEKIKTTLQIIYTTHSPYLIDVNNVHRILAVQRDDEDDRQSPTKVLSVQELGGATSDTLFPLYTNMGIDLSHQRVIKNNNNILLEEISAYFYFKAFWKLFGMAKEVQFLPATGTSHLPLLANLMLGWGLNFLVIVDDENSGRKIFNSLKDNHVSDPADLFKIKDCDGIEDLFDADDFKKLILKDSTIAISGKNSHFLKTKNLSKPVLARDFMLSVDTSQIKLKDLSTSTQKAIKDLLGLLDGRLK